MAYSYPAMVAWNPGTNTIVKNTVFQVYAPTDTMFTTPLAITDNQGNTLGNLNSGSQGVFPNFRQAQYATVVVSDVNTHTYNWTVPCSQLNPVVPWAANTYYTAGQPVVNPNGDTVTAIAAHTSGSSYNSANWNQSTTYLKASSLWFTLVPPPTGVAATDTTNIQNALNAVPTTGGTVQLQAGTYVLNAAPSVTNPTKIIGAGKGDFTTAAPTVLSVASGTADGLVINAHGCTLESFAIVNTAGIAPTAGAGVHVTAGDGLAIDRVKMVGFYNNLQIDQARHYTITDSHFMDQVNYGAYLRNTATGQGDFGDCIFHGCFFASYNTSRIANAGIRWESGGGLKVIGCKTNGNMSTLGQSFTVGVDIKVADGISTSVFVINGNSLEGIASGGAPISVGQTGTGTGTITKIIVTNNETLAGGGIRFSAIAAGKVGQILVSGNTITGPTCGIYFQNVYGITVGPNRVQALPSGNQAIQISTGCTDYTITAPDVDTTNVALVWDDSAQTNTHSRVGTTTTYTREVTSTTSNTTYTTLFSVQFNAYCAAVITLNLTGQVAGVGSFVVNAARAATQGAAATVPTISTVNADTSTANAPQVLFDVTTNQTVLVKVRLGASGTDVYGKATLTVDGLPSRVWKS